eukprot:XP_011684186.1 PREDICTED: laminin subunit beta-2 [Strongylocentrotus purpuratus]
MGTRCDQCKAGTFNLDPANPEGCTSCDCDPGAAISGSCDPETGACTCRTNIIGRVCNETMTGFYVPRLDGISIEGETATTDQPSRIEERSLGEDARHTGPGYLVVPASTVITLSGLTVPRTEYYFLAVRYEVKGDLTFALATIAPGVYNISGLCLAGSVPYDIIITLGAPDIDPQAEFLLDLDWGRGVLGLVDKLLDCRPEDRRSNPSPAPTSLGKMLIYIYHTPTRC